VGRRRVPGSGRSDDDRLIAGVITAVREPRAALSGHFSRCPNPTFATRRPGSSNALIFCGEAWEGRHHSARGQTDDGTSGTSILGGDWAGRVIFSRWSRMA
jgi:hypothetical protein